MKLHLEELELARLYSQVNPFAGLAAEQAKKISQKGVDLHHWFKDHSRLHFFISLTTVLLFLVGDFFILLWLPRVVLEPGTNHEIGRIFLAAVTISFIRSWWISCLIHYSIHEGAAHDLIFPVRGPVSKILGQISNNLSRLHFSDPQYYSESHRSHHAKFGTKEDAEFLNFIFPKRFWRSLFPLSMFINFSDFISHRPLHFTKSRIASAILSSIYALTYGYFIWGLFGPLYTLLLAFFCSNWTFYFDRLRQFSEHNLMPIENQNGARSFGPGFWGLLIGGGPWGQPCHWMHHLVPTIPWYQQIILHRYVRKMLPEAQRRQYFLTPIIGYPQLLWRLWTEPYAFIRKIEQRQNSSQTARVVNH